MYSNRKAPSNMKLVEKQFNGYDLEGAAAATISFLQDLAVGITMPQIEQSVWNESEFYMTGFRQATEKELALAKKKKLAAKAANDKKNAAALERERKEYKRLQKKFGDK